VTPERYARIGELYHQALERPREQRAAFLDEACADDVTLRDEVASLLAADDVASGFIETPAIAVAAEHLAGDHQPLANGITVGPYQVRELLGRGGMGDVYRAHDPRLGRDVALKLLPPPFARDRERLARFEREARLLAALNHPNIAAVYGIEESDGRRILVLELIDGATLEMRLAAGPIPLPEALDIASQIVEALGAAHDHGIVHRDLKPANIVIRPDGVAKVLDFGLAKALDGRVGAVNISEFSDVPRVIGTAPYMSPEQARGDAGDQRIDIWAFGCVLYEMLTGRRAFAGETRSDVIAAVTGRPPDWDALPAMTPMAIRRLVRRCLEKEPRDRLRHIADARLEIREAIGSPAGISPAAPTRPRRRWVGAAVLAVVLLTGIVSWSLWRSATTVSSPVTRFSIPVRIGAGFGGRLVAISPNGSRFVYPSDRGITVRSRDRLGGDEVSVPVDFARAPFFSPDGNWVGYTDGEALYKIPVGGGTPVFIAEVGEAALASWGTEGIVVADVGGLSRVPANGGTLERLPMPPLDPGEQAAYPELLPGGHAILFTVLPTRSITVGSSGVMPGTRVEVLNVESGTRRTLVHGGGRGHYVPTGYLVYASRTSVYAVPFDVKRLELRGEPIQVASDVSRGEFAVSDEGTLAYLSGGGEGLSTLVWTDREGHEDPLDAPPRQYIYPRLSPDGTRIALDISDPPDRDIWIWDIGRHALQRFTVDPAANPIGVWSPDGTRIAFGSDRFGPTQLYLQRADRSEEPERLLQSVRLQMPLSFAPDGRLLFSEEVPNHRRDIHVLSLDGSRRVESLVHSPGQDGNAEVSPDARWLAYDSDESGQFEVYVRPYPDTDRARWQVSVGGGKQPLWSRDGRELFYRDFAGTLFSVPVTPNATFTAGRPHKILDNRSYVGGGRSLTARTYDVSPDGRRFLLLKAPPSDATSLVIVVNWTEELKPRGLSR
jgi:eukaryotic-like serine/threonine-protein kinase